MKSGFAQFLPSHACFSSTHSQGVPQLPFTFSTPASLLQSKKFFSFFCACSRRASSIRCQVPALLLTTISTLKPHLSHPGSFQEEFVATFSTKKGWAANPDYQSNMFTSQFLPCEWAEDCSGVIPGITDGRTQNTMLCWFYGIKTINRRQTEEL